MLLSQSSAMLYNLRISLGLVFVLSNVVSFFFIFILRFWNHILMCFSERLKDLASSILRARVMYRLNRNSFSNSTCCLVVYAVLARERTVADDQDSLPRPFGLSSDENNTKIYGTVLVWWICRILPVWRLEMNDSETAFQTLKAFSSLRLSVLWPKKITELKCYKELNLPD